MSEYLNRVNGHLAEPVRNRVAQLRHASREANRVGRRTLALAGLLILSGVIGLIVLAFALFGGRP